jgi:outer membrane protein assembly factor BamB
MFHGNYNHTGYADVKGPRDGKVKWKLKAASGEEGAQPPNSIVQGPALSTDGKTLYFAGKNSIVAVRAKDGHRKWRVKAGDSTLFGPTVGPDGTIYQPSWDGKLYAIKPNGDIKWKYETAGALSYPASINKKGTIIVGGGDAHAGPDPLIYALKPNGDVKWTYDTGSTRSGSPVISPDGLIYVASGPTLFALRGNGELAWQMGPESSQAADETDPGESPIGEDDDEDIGDGPGGETGDDDEDTGDGEDTDDGEDGEDSEEGEDDEGSEEGDSESDVAGIISPAVGPDGTIYIGNSQGEIHAINPDTQEIKWTYETGPAPDDETLYGLPSFPVVDKKGVVYVGAMDGKMYAINKKGEKLWSYKTKDAMSESAPALGPDGTLYFTSDDGYLYAIAD